MCETIIVDEVWTFENHEHLVLATLKSLLDTDPGRCDGFLDVP